MTKRLPLLLPIELYRRLKLYCAKTDVSMTELVRQALTKELNEREA